MSKSIVKMLVAPTFVKSANDCIYNFQLCMLAVPPECNEVLIELCSKVSKEFQAIIDKYIKDENASSEK